nr:MAG: ORF1 [Torque teno midi virus]
MPFWWRRRRKPWFGRWRRKQRFRRYKGRRRRRLPRRRTRRPYRRRRRRTNKVRRKKKKIPIMQWQPQSIRKCKIKGHGTLVLGAEGTQMYCYTTEKMKYVPPKTPYGGGFGVEKYTLEYLYEEYIFQNNIWTASNILKDLCRFLYVRFIFYRHPDTDFVISYNNQPPFEINKWTFPSTHPHQMLLDKHKKVLKSLASKPNGKYSLKMYVKPPKQMITKWFFTKQFCKYGLLLLKASAMNLRYSHLSASNENMLINITSLNPSFYVNTDWSRKRDGTVGYMPQTHLLKPIYYKVKTSTGETILPMDTEAYTSYTTSISYDKGWFNNKFLRAIKLYSDQAGTKPLAMLNMIYGRYNPVRDNGKGNIIYIISTLADNWNPPTQDKMVVLADVPLWLGVWGYISYLHTVKPPDWLLSSCVVLKSDYIYNWGIPGTGDKWLPLDQEYLQGKKPYEQVVTEQDKLLWYPTYKWQLKTLNAIAESGPFVPQYNEEKNSTWELKYFYNFCFKWGGPETPEAEIKNPKDLAEYDVPDTKLKTIQITNPAKQSPESIIHHWDIRRGVIKEKALKRMCCHLETDTEFEYSPEGSPKKKKQRMGAALRNPQEEIQEAQACLQALCEKSTCQEEETQSLQQLIQQQQHKQQELKYNILKLLMSLKEKQNMLQLQTGMWE